MASRIIHYAIGVKILEHLHYNKNDFVMGNLFPDVHDGTFEEGAHTHFNFIVNGEYSKKVKDIDIDRFKQKYAMSFNESVVLGYYCHLLSDIRFNHLKIPRFPNDIDTFSKEYQEARKLLFNDYSIMNTVLIDSFNLIYPIDYKIPHNIIINEIDRNKIGELFNNLKTDFQNKNSGKMTFLSKKLILDYIDETVKFCVSCLKKN